MTTEMKLNLIRYGYVLYLDAQKRPFNKVGWPYIGIVVLNNMNEVCVCCEVICIGETIAMYTWILQTLQELEKGFNLSQVRIIFGDGLITMSLLKALGIEETCLLHGDYYHLMYKIFNKPDNFGKIVYDMIFDYLKVMLSSEIEE